jgi:ketosteroid isomerase-like protein
VPSINPGHFAGRAIPDVAANGARSADRVYARYFPSLTRPAANGRPNAVSGLGLYLPQAYACIPPYRMGIQQMNKLIASVLSTCVWIGTALAGPPELSKDPIVVSTIEQLEQDMGDAMVHVDIDRLNQIFADDFSTIGSAGKIITKKDLLADFASFHDRLVSYEFGSMDVQVYGDLALVYGSVCERRVHDGRDRSGKFVWMDVFKKRDGKWRVVRSTEARAS